MTKKNKWVSLIILFLVAVLSVSVGCATGNEGPSGGDTDIGDPDPVVEDAIFKADYGFKRHSVTKQDLGLGEKEYYWANFNTRNAYSYDHIKEYQYDEFLTKLAIEGMLNREEAILFLDRAQYEGGKDSPVGTDGLWPEIYADPNRQGLVKKDLEYGTPALLDTFAKYFNGVILYTVDYTEKNPSTNMVMAMNLANANFCIPISKTYYYKYKEHFKGLPLVADITDIGMTQPETYEWLLRNVYRARDVKGMLNKHTVYSMNLNFPDNRQAGGWHSLMGFDLPFSEKVFIFNLAPSATNSQVFGQEIWSNRESFVVLHKILANIDSDAAPAPILGWNEREPEWAGIVSEYGHFVQCTAAAGNLSFHTKVKTVRPLDDIMKNGFKQKAQSDFEREGENGKIYIAFLANEADAIKTRTLMFNQSWNYKDPVTGGGRGKFPLTWGMNAREIEMIPALIEYFYDTATENDYFYGSPTGGGGYCNLALSPRIDDYIEKTKRDVELLDLKGADFWYSNGATIDKLAKGLGYKVVSLDGNPSYPSGGTYTFGDNDEIPGLRYSVKNFYWQTRVDAAGKGVYTAPSTWGYGINADGFFAEFDAQRRADRPVFVPFYSMEANLAIRFYNDVMLDPRWEDANVEVVDLATLVSMSGKYEAKHNGKRENITEEEYEQKDKKLIEQQKDIKQWTSNTGDISDDNGKIRFTVTNPDKWGLMNIFNSYVPPTTTSVTVRVDRGTTVDGVDKKDNDIHMMMKISVDRNHNGVLDMEGNQEVEWVEGPMNNLTLKLSDASVQAIRQGAMVGIELGYVNHKPGNFIRLRGMEFGGAVDPSTLPKFNTNQLTNSEYWSNPDMAVGMDNGAGFKVTEKGFEISFKNWGGIRHSGVFPMDTAGIRVKVSGTVGTMVDLKVILPSGKEVFFYDYNPETNTIKENGTLEYVLGWSDFRSATNDASALKELGEVALAGEVPVKFVLGGSNSDKESTNHVVYEEFTMIGKTDFEEMRNPYFNEDLMLQSDIWQMYCAGKLEPCADGVGCKIINEESGWELASIAKKIPKGARYIKVTIGEVDCTEFVFKIHGDLDNFGVEDSWYKQGIVTSGQVVYFQLDPRITANPDQVFKVQLGFTGKGSIEYKGFQFMTAEEYNFETGMASAQFDDPDVFDPNANYNVDMNNDGIRDGDQLGAVTNLKFANGKLTFTGAEGAEVYIVEVYKADGTLFTTRQTKTDSLNLRFLKSGEYTIKVYSKALNRLESEKTEITINI